MGQFIKYKHLNENSPAYKIPPALSGNASSPQIRGAPVKVWKFSKIPPPCHRVFDTSQIETRIYITHPIVPANPLLFDLHQNAESRHGC